MLAFLEAGKVATPRTACLNQHHEPTAATSHELSRQAAKSRHSVQWCQQRGYALSQKTKIKPTTKGPVNFSPVIKGWVRAC